MLEAHYYLYAGGYAFRFFSSLSFFTSLGRHRLFHGNFSYTVVTLAILNISGNNSGFTTKIPATNASLHSSHGVSTVPEWNTRKM